MSYRSNAKIEVSPPVGFVARPCLRLRAGVRHCAPAATLLSCTDSSGASASGGSLHGDASFKVEKAHNAHRSLGNGVRKNGVRNRVRVDDAGSILKFRIGFSFGENPAGFCKSVWLPESILNFRIGSVSSIGGSIATTLFALFRFP